MSGNRTKVKRSNGEGSYYPIKGTNKYRAAIRDAAGKTRTKTFYKIRDAEEWLVDQRRSRELGQITYALRPHDTVTTFLTHYVNGSSARSSTLKSYRGAISRLHPVLGHLNASKITPRAIEDAYRTLQAKGYRHGTVLLAHRLLSVAYRDAYRLNEIPINVMAKVKAPTGKCVPTKYIPHEDVVKLYQAASADSYALARIDVGFTLGLRPGEVLGLKWSDIDWESGLITIERQAQYVPGIGRTFTPVKQDEARTIPVARGLLDILQRHRANQELEKSFWIEDGDLIFPNHVGRIMDEKKDRVLFARLCDAAGTKRYQVYQMRKTCFSSLSAHGVDPKTIQTYSGHSQITTLLNSYVFTSPHILRSAATILDQIRPKYREE